MQTLYKIKEAHIIHRQAPFVHHLGAQTAACQEHKTQRPQTPPRHLLGDSRNDAPFRELHI